MNWALIEFASADGLRADGRRRARRDHRRNPEARDEGVPAAGGAVRLEAVADADHARAGTHVARRPAVTGCDQVRWAAQTAERRSRNGLLEQIPVEFTYNLRA